MLLNTDFDVRYPMKWCYNISTSKKMDESLIIAVTFLPTIMTIPKMPTNIKCFRLRKWLGNAVYPLSADSALFDTFYTGSLLNKTLTVTAAMRPLNHSRSKGFQFQPVGFFKDKSHIVCIQEKYHTGYFSELLIVNFIVDPFPFDAISEINW